MDWKDLTHNALRIVAGFMFLCHGAQKLFGVFGSERAELVSQRGLGGLIEFFGGLLICIGLYTVWSAFLCSGTMAVAFWQFHVPRGPWDEVGAAAVLPIYNNGDLPVLFCFVFLFLWANGPGSFSLDARRRRA